MAFPATYNFAYYQGDRYEFVLRPKQANGEAFNLSGYSALFTIATARGSVEAIIGTSQSASVNSTTGTVTAVIEPEFGTTLTGNSYLYDIEMSSSASNVFTLATGTISITRDITNTYGGS